MRQNPDAYEAAERELICHEQLGRRTIDIYKILFNNLEWFDKKMKPLPNPTSIHGDKVDARMDRGTRFVRCKFTNTSRDEIIVSSQSQYQWSTSVITRTKTHPN